MMIDIITRVLAKRPVKIDFDENDFFGDHHKFSVFAKCKRNGRKQFSEQLVGACGNGLYYLDR